MLENIETLNAQAIRLASQGDYKDAIVCLKRAIIMETTNHLLWFNLGVTYRDSGDIKQAQAAVEKALELDPENTEFLDTMAILCNTAKDTESAMTYCAKALEIEPEDPHLWNTAGVIFFNRQEYTDASEAFERAVTLNPYYYDALYNLRDTYDELGNRAGKADCIERMRSLTKGGGADA
ncbi:tetratricopeptide repeat protein [Treponema parvum]|uniref:Tetratricopeptide repeat protein n=1 Tax=Treponema parvum TaxID=138851 RepID=A0A975F336_9SPIR|nr:tetratricopeptide repeat protein [Treponema parvum]QTQ13463.1 tetratricopeptide repeat protein [Treponema parvum]